MILKFFPLFLLLFSTLLATVEKSDKKILICGICRDCEKYFESTVNNVEQLGSFFADYQVLIYENNSKDQTPALLAEWARANGHVTIYSETLAEEQMPFHRTERLADARNKVMEMARDSQFAEYEFLLWADLDFSCAWPLDEIVNMTFSTREWDAVSANGIFREGIYRDRLAFRNKDYPFGPELLGSVFWEDLEGSWFAIPQDGDWMAVYSAFAGMTLYKTKSILPFSYGGLADANTKCLLTKIISEVPLRQKYMKLYLKVIALPNLLIRKKVPLVLHRQSYHTVSCCEHLVLHAAMAQNGFDKIFVNPKMVLEYPPETN